MPLSEIDRDLLERCIQRKPRAWEDFVDRYMGLVVHVVNHTVRSRGLRVRPEDCEDLCAAVFLEIIRDDFAVLRHFRRQCSLVWYLTVVARRVVVHELLKNRAYLPLDTDVGHPTAHDDAEQRITDREEIERLLEELDAPEAEVVRLYHLEGKSYEEISRALGIAPNSVGPVLSRARDKMRRAGTQSA